MLWKSEVIYDTFDISLDFDSLFGDSNADETVKFDEADHEEKIELHAGDEVSVVSLDGQDNYLAMYQIQQYDE